MHHFPKKKKLAADEWFKPKYAAKHNHTQMVIDDDVTKENDESNVVVFSGAQTHIIEKIEDPEVIWDSGSTVVLAKHKSMLEKIKRFKVTMCSNCLNRSIEEEVHWPGVGQLCPDEKLLKK